MNGIPQKFCQIITLFYFTGALLSCLQHSVDFKMLAIADQTQFSTHIDFSICSGNYDNKT